MIGTALGGYRIVKELGEGGMGIVYEAVDTALDRRVALKVLHSEYSRNPELVERFRTEAKAQANLNHTNIATLYAFVAEGGQAGMVMEYVDGENIAQIIQRRGLLPSDYAMPLFRQALLGIGYAHRRGIIHRDIKPANLMVDRQGMVKVMDFGIAKVLGSRGMTRTGTQMGTAFYMSPEQITSKGVDIRSDIYSLGVTLYEMLTASVPFQGESDFQIMSAHLNQAPAPPSRYYPYIPKGVENAVLKALEKNPDARFQTVEEFGAALEHPEDFQYIALGAAAPAGRETIVERPSAKTTPRMPATPLTPPVMQPPRPAPSPVEVDATAAESTRMDATPQQILQPPRPKTLSLRALLSTPRGKLAAAGIGVVVLIGIGLAVRPRPEPVIPDPTPPPGPTQTTSTSRQTGVIQIPPPPPLNDITSPAPGPADLKIVNFSSEAARVTPGQRTRLVWAVQGATKVMIEPAIGAVDAQGSTFVTVRRTTEFTLIAQKANGEMVRKSAVVEVAAQAPPPPPPPPQPQQLSIAFQAQQTAIRSGQSTLLRWSVPGAVMVVINPGIGRVPAEGSMPVNPARTTTYTLTARSAAGAASSSEVTVQVEPAYTPPPPPPAPVRPEITFDVVPNSIQQGQAAMLRWSIRNAHWASITPAPGALTRTVGEFRVSPAATTTYTLTARAQDGTTSTATATLQVAAPAAPATRPISVVHDHGNSLNQYAWPSCYGFLQVVGGNLRYTVSGSTDGRADGFEIPLNQIQEIKTNRMNIRAQTAFHVTIRGQHLNFVARGISAAQAVYQIETEMRQR